MLYILNGTRITNHRIAHNKVTAIAHKEELLLIGYITFESLVQNLLSALWYVQ